MPYFGFIWTHKNVDHIAEHDITPEEVEEVICNPVSTEISRESGNPIAFGYTSAGRFLACVYEMVDEVDVYPVTAWEEEK